MNQTAPTAKKPRKLSDRQRTKLRVKRESELQSLMRSWAIHGVVVKSKTPATPVQRNADRVRVVQDADLFNTGETVPFGHALELSIDTPAGLLSISVYDWLACRFEDVPVAALVMGRYTGKWNWHAFVDDYGNGPTIASLFKDFTEALAVVWKKDPPSQKDVALAHAVDRHDTIKRFGGKNGEHITPAQKIELETLTPIVLETLCVCGHARKCHDVFVGNTGACYHSKRVVGSTAASKSDCSCLSFTVAP